MQRGKNLYHFGPFRLDADDRVLTREGRIVPLAPKALLALLFLVRNHGRVVDKEVLLKEVWPDQDVEEGNLAQNVFMLRKALGETTGKPRYIETVPRRGYRFAATPVLIEKADDKSIGSLAVLPFANVASDSKTEYLADGITEALISRLSQLAQLKVIARSTVFRYRGIAINPQEVGSSLGVCAVMTGTVLKLGEWLVVTVELVDVEDGSRIWGYQFKRKSSNILSLQEDLAYEVSEKLRLRLSGEQRERITRRFTQDPAAYDSYLKGRYSCNKRTDADLRRGAEYFRQALTKDRNYSLAYAGLADCLLLLGLFGAEPPQLVMPQAKQAALAAIHLDEELGEAYASLAQIRLVYDWDWEGADRDFKQAIRLSPAYSTAHQWRGEYLVAMGSANEGLEELRNARDLDPLSLIINTELGLNLYWNRQYDLAIDQLKCAMDLEPGLFRGHLYLGMAYSGKSNNEEAIAELKKARLLDENPYTLAGLGYVCASLGKNKQSQECLSKLLKLSRERYVSKVNIAMIHAGFGDHVEEALDYLEGAYQERAGFLVWLNVCPLFDSIRSEPRFIDLQRRLRFPKARNKC